MPRDEEKLRAYADPEVRAKLHEEAVESQDRRPGDRHLERPGGTTCGSTSRCSRRTSGLQGKTIGQIAKEQGKGIIDAFLDLVVEEKLETDFLQAENNVDDEAIGKILTHPNAIIGLGDGGAHVQFHGGYGYSTRLLGEWVREKQVMTLEQAVRRLTFDSASTFGLYDRGLLRPGMAADIVIFDPATVKPLPRSVVHDFPAGGWRIKEPAAGHLRHDRQRPGAAEGRRAHRRPARPRAAQHLLQGQPRVSGARIKSPSPSGRGRLSGARRVRVFRLRCPHPPLASRAVPPLPRGRGFLCAALSWACASVSTSGSAVTASARAAIISAGGVLAP